MRTLVLGLRSLAPSHACTIERVLDRMGDIRMSEAHHGPAGDRRWEYLPNWLFRGLTELHLEFQPDPVTPGTFSDHVDGR